MCALFVSSRESSSMALSCACLHGLHVCHEHLRAATNKLEKFSNYELLYDIFVDIETDYVHVTN